MGRNWNVSDVNTVASSATVKTKDVRTKSTRSTSGGSNLLGKISLAIGIVCVICGIGLFTMSFMSRYENSEGSPMTVKVTITDIHEQVDTEVYTNAEAQVTKYHLKGTYDLSGKPQEIVLNESYYSESEAKELVNSTRDVALDSIKLTELKEKPINYLVCGVPICVGLVLIIIYMMSIIISNKRK